MDRQIEPVAIIRLPHELEPHRHALGVAIGAAWRNLVAPGEWIPGRFGPFDGGVLAHSIDPVFDLQARYLAKMLEIAGDQCSTVGECDTSDKQVGAADFFEA